MTAIHAMMVGLGAAAGFSSLTALGVQASVSNYTPTKSLTLSGADSARWVFVIYYTDGVWSVTCNSSSPAFHTTLIDDTYYDYKIAGWLVPSGTSASILFTRSAGGSSLHAAYYSVIGALDTATKTISSQGSTTVTATRPDRGFSVALSVNYALFGVPTAASTASLSGSDFSSLQQDAYDNGGGATEWYLTACAQSAIGASASLTSTINWTSYGGGGPPVIRQIHIAPA